MRGKDEELIRFLVRSRVQEGRCWTTGPARYRVYGVGGGELEGVGGAAKQR